MASKKGEDLRRVEDIAKKSSGDVKKQSNKVLVLSKKGTTSRRRVFMQGLPAASLGMAGTALTRQECRMADFRNWCGTAQVQQGWTTTRAIRLAKHT